MTDVNLRLISAYPLGVDDYVVLFTHTTGKHRGELQEETFTIKSPTDIGIVGVSVNWETLDIEENHLLNWRSEMIDNLSQFVEDTRGD